MLLKIVKELAQNALTCEIVNNSSTTAIFAMLYHRIVGNVVRILSHTILIANL